MRRRRRTCPLQFLSRPTVPQQVSFRSAANEQYPVNVLGSDRQYMTNFRESLIVDRVRLVYEKPLLICPSAGSAQGPVSEA